MNRPPRVGVIVLALFASLYALQGVVVAYFFNFNLTYMVNAGVPKDSAAGAQSLALIPFILKFLAGPISDRISLLGLGHRKPYILFGLAVQLVGLLALSWLNPAQSFTEFTIVAFLTVTGLAIYDTCCDGMVIDVTPPEDRARVQGLLVAARAIAAMVCSLEFGRWLDDPKGELGPFREVLWICAGLGIIPIVLALFVAEPIRSENTERFHWAAFRALIVPRSLVLLGFGALYSIVGYGVEMNLTPFYKSSGFKERAIGEFGATRYFGRAIGAASMTLASRRFGRGWILTAGIVALAATTIVQSWLAGVASTAIGGFAFGAANGWNDAVFFVLAMEASDPRMAASTYALFMAVTNVSVLGGWLFSTLETAFGRYPPAFAFAALAAMIALVSVPALSRPPAKPEPVDVVA
jgi:PAT family beta-lactamase induction signal transducer AmpG